LVVVVVRVVLVVVAGVAAAVVVRSAGVGVAVVSRLTVGLELQVGRLALVRLSDLTIRRPLHRLAVRGRHESGAVGQFMRMLRAEETMKAER